MKAIQVVILVASVVLLASIGVEAQTNLMTLILGEDGVGQVRGIGSDTNGDIAIADQLNHRVKYLFANGSLITIAGTGVPGFSGDGGFGYLATVNGPTDADINVAGEVFFTQQNAIRRVDNNNIITTFVGDVVTPGIPTDGALAVATTLNQPLYLAFAPNGNLYFVQNGGEIYYLTPGENTVSQVFIFGTVSGLGTVRGIEADEHNLFVSAGTSIRVFDLLTEATVTTINVGSSVAEIAFNADQSLFYVADAAANLIREYNAATFAATGNTFGDGLGQDDTNSFDTPRALAYSYGRLFVGSKDTNGLRVLTLNSPATFPKVADLSETNVVPGASICSPSFDPASTAVDAAGNVYFADQDNGAVYRIRADNDQVELIASGLNLPQSLFYVTAVNQIYFVNAGTHQVRIIDLNNNNQVSVYAGTGTAGRAGNNGAAANAQLNNPWAVTVTSDFFVLITELGDGVDPPVVRAINTGLVISIVTTLATTDLPGGIAYDGVNNRIYIAFGATIGTIPFDTSAPAPGAFTVLAGVLGQADFVNGPFGTARFSTPDSLAPVFNAGAITNLYVSDETNGAIRLLNIGGSTVSTPFGATTSSANVVSRRGAYDTARRHALAPLDTPTGLTFTSTGLYFVELNFGLVFKACTTLTTGCNLCSSYPDNDCFSTCGITCSGAAGRDVDDDLVCASTDNCDLVANNDQLNFDGDNFGDACDNCPFIANNGQEDTETPAFDGVGDVCDNCPAAYNPDQRDTDVDGTGDVCDATPNGSPRPSGSSGSRPNGSGIFSIFSGATVHQAAPAPV